MTVRGDIMDNIDVITRTDAKRRAHGSLVTMPDLVSDAASDYSGRHVRWVPPTREQGVHPRGQGFRILSRLARADHTAA